MQIQCIGRMFTLGYPVNLRQVNNHNRGKFVRYPTYPWQETELWANDNFQGGSKTFPLLGNPIAVNSDELKWSTDIDVHSFSYLKDHQLHSLGNQHFLQFSHKLIMNSHHQNDISCYYEFAFYV